MKQLLTASLLLLVFFSNAQEKQINFSEKAVERFSNFYIKDYSNYNTEIAYNDVVPKILKKKTRDSHLKYKIFKNLKGTDEGFYVISGVFSNLSNAQNQAQQLKNKDFNSSYIANTNNNLFYVYLDKFNTLDKAIETCNSNFKKTYSGKFWLMNVDNSQADKVTKTKELILNSTSFVQDTLHHRLTTQNPEQDVNLSSEHKKQMLNTSLSSDNELNTLLSPVVKNDSVVSNNKKDRISPKTKRLIEKADEYFDMMWYAEAADLYEEAIKEDANNYSMEILEKAGDSYYFNSNMIKAYYYYNLIFEKYKDEVSANQIFKYAHTLKGNGKYAKSKRMMRLYDREIMKRTESSEQDFDPIKKEMELDNILNTTHKFELKNLAINTEYSEFSPMYHNKDEIVFASAKNDPPFNTIRYKWNDQPYLDLYASKINEESHDLKEAMRFSKKINSKYHEAAVSFTPDNSTMYFTRNNYGKKLRRDKKGVSNLKIYVSKKVNGEWAEATELPFNSDDFSTGHPALSVDGKKLYFISDRPGTIGETDIFVVDILEDGNYSEPKNLGPKINTEQKEMFPFVNNEKLYFASNGHVGLGGLDIYEVTYDEKGFNEVVNLGKPINSNKDDFSYIVNEKTQQGYFASNRQGGKGDDDIYSFKKQLPEEAVENAIAGVVTDLITGDVMPKALVTLLDENNIKLKEMITEDDGSFLFEDLDSNTKYTIKTTKKGYFENEVSTATKENGVVHVDISLKMLKELIVIEDGIKKLKTDMIFFDFDKSYIRKDAAIELNKLVEVMTEYQDMVIKIESHTDSRGPDTYNKYLSDKRAKASKAYLISKGISADRIESAIGYGEERLMNKCSNGVPCTSSQHEINRRSEFIIVKM